MDRIDRPRPILPPSIAVGVLLAALAVIAIAMSGLGTRWGWWNFRTGFVVLKWGAYAAIAAALITILGAVLARGTDGRRSLTAAAVVTVIALGVVYVPWRFSRAARAVPPIHDITTDFDNPPGFVVLRDQRVGASNSIDYGGPSIAAQQRAGYPDIGAITLELPPSQALERAADVAAQLGWKIAAKDTATGRIEATDRTRWFGFTDDIVVRISPAAGGSRVDIRSLSRVGKSDVGTNARRVRTFLSRLH